MRLSPAAELACHAACVETALVKRQFMDPEQLLAGMTKLRQFCSGQPAQEARAQGLDIVALKADLELVADRLANLGIDPDALRRELRQRVEPTGHTHEEGAVIHRSDRSRALFERAEQIALQMNLDELTVAPLFLAILEEEDSLARRVLIEHGAEIDSLIEATYGRVCPKAEVAREHLPANSARPEERAATPWLDRIGDDLTEKARQGLLGPFVGRREEMVKIRQVLARRSTSNPVLVGQPGVGRTAIVQALAAQTARDRAAGALGERFITLDGSLLTGPGESAQQRLLNIIEECRANPQVILHVQQLHVALDKRQELAGILRAALARGDLHCLGVATPQEYERGIESDLVMSQLFERVSVTEPDRAQTLSILAAVRPRWEQSRQLVIPDEVLETLVDLSIRFELTRCLPGKAVEILDEACARTLVRDRAEQVVDDLVPEAHAPLRSGSSRVVTIDSIVRVLSEKTGLPPEVIARHTRRAGPSVSSQPKMEAFLAARVTGQDRPIHNVCQHLMAAYSTIGDSRGPLAVFLFLGPLGAGKTTLARALAAFLRGSEEELARFDMSGYSDEISASRFVGQIRRDDTDPPEGLLARRLRRMPHSVVLLDHIEAAHPCLQVELLRIFREGRLEDGWGRGVDARLATFILESDLDWPESSGTDQDDSAWLQSPLVKQWWSQFPASFSTYVDEQIVFKALGPQQVKQVITRRLDLISRTFLARHQRPVLYAQSAVDWLTSQACAENRPMADLERMIYRSIEVPLTRLVETQSLQGCTCIAIGADGGHLRVDPYSGPVPTA
jgi:ATP-dependent Clp protease ATP-binding subunit ClpC